jgi:2-C-methyl-D-erythritol 4-phosphate cytidylyltransferase/2-C-methyl-D-erythritol 2,4-cyclodiphosphate synthase
MQIAALIVAAGRGTRAGGPVPKQYQALAGQPVLGRTLAAFGRHPRIAMLCAVLNPDDAALYTPVLPENCTVVAGGRMRDASVIAGLAALPPGITHVLIHDGARPLVSAALIGRVCDALRAGPAAAPALPVTDALWRAEGARVAAPHPRDGLWRAQTPQGFDLAAIRAAHAAHPGGAADDVEVALAAGLPVTLVPGEETNLKITHAEDFARAETFLKDREGSAIAFDIRTGTGYDVHRFGPGTSVIICGVEIPHERGLQGHSDADVGMHALTDAIYGALAEGDIGRHFPPGDPQWKGAASHIFLRHAVDLATARGFRITNLDCTLICERPKIGPHAGAMQAALAGITGLEPGRISVKATTSERLGFTGREEGIAAMAAATLVSE